MGTALRAVDVAMVNLETAVIRRGTPAPKQFQLAVGFHLRFQLLATLRRHADSLPTVLRGFDVRLLLGRRRAVAPEPSRYARAPVGAQPVLAEPRRLCCVVRS